MKTKLLSFYLPLGLVMLTLSVRVIAQPGHGILLGENTVLVPSVTLSYNYNDNVALRGRALSEGSGGSLDQNESDSFFKYIASLKLSRAVANRRLILNSWYGQDSYQDFTALDGETYGGSGAWLWTRPDASTTAEISAKYEHAVDRVGSENVDLGTNPLPEVANISDRVERDIISTNIEINQDLINRLSSSFIFAYDDIQYEEDLYNNRTSYDYIVELNYRASDKSQPYVRLGMGIDDDEGFDGNAEKPFVLGGIRYTATAKLRFDAAAGYETYTRTPAGGAELEDSGLKYTLNAHYKATAKTLLRLSGRNGYDSVSNSTSSSRRENALSLLLRHQTTRKMNQSLMLSWREDDYLSPISVGGSEIDEVKETLRYQYHLNYQTVRPWLSLFGRLSYEDGSSNIPGDDYDETEVTLGATISY